MKPAPRPYDHQWEKLAARHRRSHPLCEVAGCGERAVHVDHIVTVAARPALRLEPSNLQSLCQHHHSALTKAYDAGRLDGACDGDGLPLDPNHPWNQPDNAAAIERANKRSKADPLTAAKLKRRYVNGFGWK